MKKRRMRLMALVVAAMMICGLAIAEPVHEHQWSAWQKSADHPNQETRTCLTCSAVETREHEWGPWTDMGDGTEKHTCINCQKEEFRKIETPAIQSDSGEGAGISLLNENDTGMTPDPDPNANTPADPDPNANTPADPDPNANTPADPDPNANTPADPDPNANTPADPDPNANTPTDPDTGTDNPDGDPVAGQAELQISLTVDRTEAKAGDELTYTVTVTNAGTADAQNVKVSFALPADLQIVETSYGGTLAETTLSPLNQGDTTTVSLKARVLETAAHGTTLTVTASANNTASEPAVTTVLESPQLSLALTASSDTVTAGETLAYTVTLTNDGRGPAVNATVAVTLPQGLENVAPDTPDGTVYADGLWTVPALAAGESMALVLRATVMRGMPDGTDLTAQAQGMGVSADGSAMPATFAAPIVVSAPVTLSAPALTITVTADHKTAATGSTVNYIVTVSNSGSAEATGVDVTVSLPAANLKLGTVTPKEGTSWVEKSATWTIPSLAMGDEATLQLMTFVTDVKPGDTVTGSASVVQVDGTSPATQITASAAFTGENAAVNLSITKTADRLSAQPGEELRYTLVVTNNGKAAINSIQVSEKLPDKLLFAEKELTQGTTYDEATGLWTIPVLEPGAQATLVVRSVVMDAREGQNLVNTAEIISVDGAEPAVHPTATASVLINAISYGFLTVNKTVTGSGASRHRDFPFQVVFTDAAGVAVHGIGIYVKGTESHTFDTAYPLTFELRHDETVWIGVPTGMSYTVTETDIKGYGLTSKNDKGVIQTDQLIQATFVNDRQRNTDIPKTGYADQAPDAAVEQPAVAEDLTQAYAQNDDLVGWLKAGDGIDLPVVQSDNTYYLDHGFTGEENKNGTLFLNMNNQLFPADDVLLIHGHNMKDGSMFGTLSKFERYDYACEHPIVTFQTIHDEEPVYYVPISVFNASMLPDHSSYFDITQIVFPDDEEGGEEDSSTFRQSTAFRTYLDELKAVSLWESPVDVNVDDKLLMLITCSYDLEDGRLMVVCRRLRDGETPEEVAELFAK
ncbi:MAG TPA: DUF11 domain-containing protein [Candidatus Limiplasma pullicola]|nr:DUF11 domain-containing protein [Candidatus Limiplasma pullicola]